MPMCCSPMFSMKRNTPLSNRCARVCNPVTGAAVGSLKRPPAMRGARRPVPLAVMFPGQGTQGPGMGAPWRGHPAWEVVARAEDALGEPLAPLLLAESADDLVRTREAPPSV